MDQTITVRLDNMSVEINGRNTRLNLEVTLTPNDGSRIRCRHLRRLYEIAIDDTDLTKHLFFTENRSSRDALRSRRHVDRGLLAQQTMVAELQQLELTVGGRPHTISPTITSTLDNMTISCRMGRRTVTIRIPNTELAAHVGNVIGHASEYALRARRFA